MSNNYHPVNATTTTKITKITMIHESFQTVSSSSDGRSRNAAEKQPVMSLTTEGTEKGNVKTENTSETHEDKQPSTSTTTTTTTTTTKETILESENTGSETREEIPTATATGREETINERENTGSETREEKQTATDIAEAYDGDGNGRNQGVECKKSVKNCNDGKEECSTGKGLQEKNTKRVKKDLEIYCKENKLIEKGSPSVWSIPLMETSHNQYRFGDVVEGKPNKKIMMVGARGSGKTTLINAMINYILNVERKDHFRFKLVTETTNKSQAHSQTSEIIVYEINHREGFNTPFSLTIIDTPGFGDTWGMSQDDEIVEQIRKFFSKTGGIDQIDCICFVVQAALACLTVTQNYIFNSILSIFGKDIEENIQILVTFADGQPPPVLTAIEEAQVPCSKTKENHPVHFKFNNSAVFAKRTENTNYDEGNDSDAEEFDEMFWRMGTKSMEKYFTALGKMETKSLSLTMEVLKERKHLQTAVEDLQPQINAGLVKLEELRKTIAALEQHKTLKERKHLQTAVEGLQPQINAGFVKLEELRKTIAALEQHKTLMDENKDFEYEVEITVGEKEDVEHILTNCQLCRFTCHENCLLANDEDKIECVAMKDGKCTVCPGKCVWNVHSNQTYKWTYITKKEKRTYRELKKKYEETHDEKMTTEKIFQQPQMEFDVCELKVLELVEETSRCLKRLKEIALIPNPLQTPEYIDLLIEGEKQEAKPGYQERIKSLIGLREHAVIIVKIAKEEQLLPKEKEKYIRTQNVKEAMKSGANKLWSIGKRFMDYEISSSKNDETLPNQGSSGTDARPDQGAGCPYCKNGKNRF